MKKTFKDYMFVGVQFLLFAIYFFELPYQISLTSFWVYFGLMIAITGVGFTVLALVQLNTNLTAFPTPKHAANLVTGGLYSFSRHPIYTGLILFTLGYALFKTSWLKLMIALLLWVWFYLKSVYEEERLMMKFPDYQIYKTQVGRFFPKIKKPQI